MKKVFLILLLGCVMTLTMFNHAKSEPVTTTTEMSESCVTYRVENVRGAGWVVHFTNSCNKKVTVTYDYYSSYHKKWLENEVRVPANSNSRNNDAGIDGKIKNVEWKYSN